MNNSLFLNLESLIIDALAIERDYLKGRACTKTGNILNRHLFKSAGAGFTFSLTRPINIPVDSDTEDAKTILLNIEVGLPTPENDFEYSFRINFPVAFQIEEDDHCKCGLLKVLTSKVSFVDYTRFVSIRNNEVDDEYDYSPTELEGEVIRKDEDTVCLIVNKRGMSFNPRILEDITVVFKEDDIAWRAFKIASKEHV